MDHPRPLMLFAAGFGTRMAPLTDSVPKPLIPVGQRALIDHALHLARDARMAPIVVNVHYRADMIRAHLKDQADIAISEETEILDTGGGLARALPLLGATVVATLNTDAVWTGQNPLAALGRAWDPARMDALLSVIEWGAAVGFSGQGDFDMTVDGQLSRGTGWVYTGAQILATDPMQAIDDPVFSLNRVWDLAAAKGRLFGVTHGGRWCDVGRPSSIALAEAMLAEDALLFGSRG